ncbi:SIS domain-containing protein [Sporosarcina sp. Marseille-Q4063]|uniref:SIS domain-containing protein n=1 Tax=Sporosarcina sp. Marseille-Q4063 TaxID=2810514 RepID=UPI001BB0BA9C|nr:SIS domain-containing protein [Sporosarcina sp. Marseille-Q4063]QUW21529.1 SIS domain-containing protein [Sporosarcina sp. Marseille-Q4063]
MFNITVDQMTKQNAVHTTGEIHQQPAVWQELIEDFFAQQASYKEFLETIYKKHQSVRVIFTGAGTSAFVGDTLVPELAKQNNRNIQFESIPTTDIVSNPTEYLFKEQPTILVSFARSGNSPESVATVSLGQEIVDDFYQVVITCNKIGLLAENIKEDKNSITLLMPEKANDQSLAMTSSFTSMIIAGFALFTDNVFSKEVANQVIESAEQLVENLGDRIDEILEFDFERIVYLGSGLLAQLSHEAALKMLELSNGQVVAIHESSLGFRHGPKSILNDQSAVVLFVSQNPYTRKYDLDILRELAAADTFKIIALTETKDDEVAELANWQLTVNRGSKPFANDFNLSLLYAIFAQVLALKKSLQLGITPDNPSPDGLISRVVKGVTIYDYQ